MVPNMGEERNLIYKMDFRKRAYLYIEKLLSLSPIDAELLEEYFNFREFKTGASARRLYKLGEILFSFYMDTGTSFLEVKPEELQAYLLQVKRTKANWTFKSYCSILKSFYRWLSEKKGWEGFSKVDFPQFSHEDDLRSLERKRILKPEEIEKLLEVCAHPRDKALFSLFYESGARTSEVGMLRVKDIGRGKGTLTIHILHGKGGTVRRVPIISSKPYIEDWLSVHPLKKNPGAFVFIALDRIRDKEPLSERAMLNMLKKALKRAGINPEGINLHTFRHSSATYWAPKLSTEAFRKKFGWSPTSRVPARYIHLNYEDVEEEYKRAVGMEKSKENNFFEFRLCPVCEAQIPMGLKRCKKCGHVLDYDEALRAQEEDLGKAMSILERLMSMDSSTKEALLKLLSGKDKKKVCRDVEASPKRPGEKQAERYKHTLTKPHKMKGDKE